MNKGRLKGWFCLIGMIVLILDTKTAFTGAKYGFSLCVETVIPALFPMMTLSIFINNCIIGKRIRLLEPIGRICGIPHGAESILLLGLIGGYPVGAQCIYQSYETGQLSEAASKKMLMFCSNAGPAFIFGITSSLFSNAIISWRLWMIHVVSALLVGILASKDSNQADIIIATKPLSFQSAVKIAAQSLSSVCCWVILFRVIITFITKWLKRCVSAQMLVIIIGLCELTNGCIVSSEIADESMRFILTSLLLGFGGCCVVMQTASVVGALGIRTYLKGKVLQCVISVLISTLISKYTQLSNIKIIYDFVILAAVILIGISIKHILKKTVAFQRKVMYNQKKQVNEV